MWYSAVHHSLDPDETGRLPATYLGLLLEPQLVPLYVPNGIFLPSCEWEKWPLPVALILTHWPWIACIGEMGLLPCKWCLLRVSMHDTLLLSPCTQARKLPPYCPLQPWKHYYSVRGLASRILFHRADGQPIARRDFAWQLSLSLQACQLSSSLYATQSFRIEAATYAACRGFGNAQLRSIRRCNSDALKRYIRV